MIEGIIILAVIGLCKAWSDTIAHHQNKMRFNTRWFKSIWNDKKYHFWVFKYDAWHVFENIIIAIILYLAHDNYLQTVINALIYWITFTIFYEKILIRK